MRPPSRGSLQSFFLAPVGGESLYDRPLPVQMGKGKSVRRLHHDNAAHSHSYTEYSASLLYQDASSKHESKVW